VEGYEEGCNKNNIKKRERIGNKEEEYEEICNRKARKKRKNRNHCGRT